MAITQFTWATHDLADPSTYYGGWKEGRLLQAGVYRRALSDRRGELETSQFSVAISDVYGVSTSRLMRGKLAGVTSKYLINRTVVARTVTDEARRNLDTPRTIGVGLIRSYKPVGGMRFELTCADYLSKFTASEKAEQQIPKRRMNRTDFVDLPTNMLDTPVPIIYGDCSSQASATAPPGLVINGSEGAAVAALAKTSITVPYMGYGSTGILSAPTGTSATEAGGGTLVRGRVPGDTFYFLVTAYNGSGESDPSASFSCTLTGDNKKIDVAWSAVGGATGYRVYMGYDPYDTGATQFIQTASTSCSFTADPGLGIQPTTANITAGANVPTFREMWVYAVSALMSDGETVISQQCVGLSLPYRRPVRVRWGAVAGALGYFVYRRNAKTKGIYGAEETANWDRKWSVSSAVTFFDDDLLDTGVTFVEDVGAVNGAVPLIPAGTELASDGSKWFRFLVCGHAVKAITGLFLEGEQVDPTYYGTLCCVPGKTGYSTYFPNTGSPQYRDLNGRRYTFVYARGATAAKVHAGELKASVNVQGIETNGDGTGTLITDLFDQYLHFLRNWGFGDYQNGAWEVTGPTWPDVSPAIETISDAAFAAAKATAQTRISGGYVGGGMIGADKKAVKLADVLRDWNLSTDAFAGIDQNGQYAVYLLPDTVSSVATVQEFTQARDIISGTFEVTDLIDSLENKVVYVYSRDYSRGRWQFGEQTIRDTESITNYGEEKAGDQLPLAFVRSTTVAADIAQRRLNRTKVPLRMVKWEAGLYGMNVDLGDVVTVTHAEGIGASGYQQHPVFVMRHEFDSDRKRVTITALDIDRLLAGAFILGDETSLAASWTSATATQKQYGYLGDETTGFFSDGAQMKTLR